MPRVETLPWGGVPDGEWDDLFAADPAASPFQSRLWAETYARYYGGRPFLLAAREGRDLVGLWVLSRSGGSWRTVRPYGVGPSDLLHPLSRNAEAAAALYEAALAAPGGDLADLHQLRADLFPPVGASGTEQARVLLVDLPETYDAYLATLGKSLRYDARGLDRLAKKGEIEVEEGNHVETLIALHERRWRRRGLPGAFFGRSGRFHREWAARAHAAGFLRMSVLRHRGEVTGALYAMRTGRTTFFYQSGFSPDAGKVSPGTLLVAHTIRRAIEEGSRVFDLMRGAEGYKRRWMPTREESNRRVLVAANARGRAGLAWNERAARIEDRVRARLEGRGLIG